MGQGRREAFFPRSHHSSPWSPPGQVPSGAQRGPHHRLEGEGRGWDPPFHGRPGWGASSLPSRLPAKRGNAELFTFPPSIAASPKHLGCLISWVQQGWNILSWQDVPSGTAIRGVAPLAPSTLSPGRCCPVPVGAFQVLKDSALRGVLLALLLGAQAGLPRPRRRGQHPRE